MMKSRFFYSAVMTVIAVAGALALGAAIAAHPAEAGGVVAAGVGASFISETFNPEKLLGPNADLLMSRQITLISGQNMLRGAVLGKTATAGTIGGAAVAGNTGNGVLSAMTVGGGAKEGRYKVTIIEPATNAGAFVVEDPEGKVVGHGTVAVGFTGDINFTLGDGGTDFVAGDQFNIDVSGLTVKYKQVVAAATDGSAVPDAILAEDTDASGGDKVTIAYFRGDFQEGGLAFGAGHTADTVRETLRDKGIVLFKAIAA